MFRYWYARDISTQGQCNEKPTKYHGNSTNSDEAHEFTPGMVDPSSAIQSRADTSLCTSARNAYRRGNKSATQLMYDGISACQTAMGQD